MEGQAPKVGGWCSNLLMELDSSRIKSTSAAPRKQCRKAYESSLCPYSCYQLFLLESWTIKINLFIETEVFLKKYEWWKGFGEWEKRTEVNFTVVFLGAGLVCTINPFEEAEISVCKGQNDNCSNATLIARFICKTRPTLKAATYSLRTSNNCYRQLGAFSEWPSLVIFLWHP